MRIKRTCIQALLPFAALAVLAAPAAAREVHAENHCNSATAARIVTATNAYRASLGLPQLQPTPALVRFAAQHTQDMATHDVLTHSSSNGQSFADRAHGSSYAFTSMRENVAVEGAPFPHKLGSNLLELWRHSPEHDANLRAPEITQIGVAVARGADGCYATMDLGQPLA
jgi:uncharacterized protein YkwD